MLYIILLCISRFIFLLMTLFAVYFIFILDYRYDIRKKADLSDFFFLIQVQNGLLMIRDNSKRQKHIWPRNC